MDNARLHKYYRSYNSGFHWMIYRFLVADNNLRRYLNLGPYCGIVTFFICIMTVAIVVCSFASSNAMTSNEKVFHELQDESEKKIPRKKSVVGIRPAYSCIHKHLRQTKVFQDKTKKMLCKEHLELDILNSRISCINKLLQPEAQSEWRRSRSPKVYYRAINATATR